MQLYINNSTNSYEFVGILDLVEKFRFSAMKSQISNIKQEANKITVTLKDGYPIDINWNDNVYDEVYVNDVLTTYTDVYDYLVANIPSSGASPSNPHDLGVFANLAALQTLHATGVLGDYAILADTDSFWIWDDDNAEWHNSGVTNTQGITTATHAEAHASMSANTLISGNKYLISDAQTKYKQEVTDAIITAAAPEPLLLLATSTSTLETFARSILYPKDIIHYDILDVTCEDGLTARKGKITYRLDTIIKQEADFDFRNVLSRSASNTNVNTFGSGCINNSIDLSNPITSNYPNIILGDNCENNEFKYGCFNIELGDNAKNNTFHENIKNLDLTLQPELYEDYHCDIFSLPNGDVRIKYIDQQGNTNFVIPS